MLISRVEDEMSAEGRQEGQEASDAHEYQTASELFDLMARNHPLEDVSESLSTRDLVILYKNIDLGTKLMSNAEECRLTRRPNQHVETVVYNDDPDSEGSDVSEIYGNDELHDVFMINNERLNLFNSQPSFENTLCPKLGDLEIQASNLSFQYNQHFLFKDPYIKEQLKNLSHVDGEFDGSALPASLLDYICCKRLEDNYTFYMDNIIRYVKHTIEQLKRISNGDYLTDKVKEKWREVEDVARDNDNTKVLATSRSIPLQVERKVTGLSTTWDDIIHSEVDIRSLSKILEKKIVLEVPKLICGSYKLFSKFCSDNLVISCTKVEQPLEDEKKEESRVDVVLKLGRSQTGQVISNISSIMILQPTLPILPVEAPEVLTLPFIETKKEKGDKKVKIIEIPEIKEDSNECAIEEYDDEYKNENSEEKYENLCDTKPIDDIEDDISFFDEYKNDSMLKSGEDSSVALRDILDKRAIPDVLRKEAPYNFISPDDLSLSIHKINNMSSLPEEMSDDTTLNPANKKKSLTKVRVKSPYENKSHIIEEKKRKKLLEIREKREKKKMAMGENCKITKHRYGKGASMPQSSSSVTKLSITNKSFYNSIYGQNLNIDKQSVKSKGRRSKRESSIDTPLDLLEGELDSPMLTPEKNNKKYINRSYYLDDAVTEMMYTEMKNSDCSSSRELFSGSASGVSAEFSTKMSIISQMINSPQTVKNQSNNKGDNEDCFEKQRDVSPNNGKEDTRVKIMTSSKSLLNVPVPDNSPKEEEDDNEDSIKPHPVECRKSIDKLYDLMKKIRKIDTLSVKDSKSRLFVNMNRADNRAGQENSIIQGSDSGTSLKHHLTSSNPSSFSFDKIQNTDENNTPKNTSSKKTDALTTVVPKVIISTKQQQPVKMQTERARKDRKKVVINPVPDNPLKAISQLLHEFDNVQKTRHKTPTDPKASKKPEVPLEARNQSRPVPPRDLKRRSRLDQLGREKETKVREIRESDTKDTKNINLFFPKEKRPKPNPAMEPLKIPHQQIPIEDKFIDRDTKKKIADILDEVKEAKGEAVRGPSKPTSRLNTLAQPKKSYVQAHSEEYQTRYGRNLIADRLQRLASTPQSLQPSPPPGLALRKPRPREVLSSAPPVQPLERGRPRRSAASSPEGRAPPASGSQARATDAPDTMKDKMVAVESYVKSHYGRSSPTMMPNELLKARVPLVPTDLDIASVPSSPTGEESTAIGSRLHHIISLMNPKPPPLSALLEAHETNSKASYESVRTPNDDQNDPEVISLSIADYPHEPASSIDSDYRADIFEDKNVKTAVQNIKDKTKEQDDEMDSDKSIMKYDGDSCNSSVELQKLEEALHGRAPAGTFQKRLRLKNITLTPKQSIRQLMVLESGDTGSIILKSSVSKGLMSCSHSENDIKSLTNLGNSHLDWRFSNIPVQVATVGYAFPEYNASLCGRGSPIKSLENIFRLGISVSNSDNKKLLKNSQCLEGVSHSQSKHDAREVAVRSDETTEASPSMKKQLTTVSVATDVYVNHIGEEICRDCTNLPDVNRSLKEVENHDVKAIENVDCTSSLDMLVGLLNEIQKITTCHMTYTEVYANEQECNELATLLNNDALDETVKGKELVSREKESRELVSIASLDKLRQLESSPSIYSLYLSNDEKESIVNTIGVTKMSAKSVLCNNKPDFVDKEVGVDFPVRELMNTFTNVPSKFFPITITHSTNVTNSLVGILSKPSSHTVISFQEYEIQDTLVSSDRKIIEIIEETKSAETLPKLTTENHKTEKKTHKCKVEKKKPCKVRKAAAEINLFSKETKCCVRSSDFDPMMKVKREFLVTVYSMLVLTVLALSFPEILYHV